MKLFNQIWITLLIIISNYSYLTAQNVVVKNYGVNDGLPSSECYWVTQDSKHFLWIATDAGVVKYDGYKFITYNSNKGLPDNTVFKIHEDKKGKIWFATYSGKIAYYLHETDSIYTIACNNAISGLTKGIPVDFCFDEKDTLWVSILHDGYLKIIPPFYDKFIHFNTPMVSFYLKEINNSTFIYGVDTRNKAHRLDTLLPFHYATSHKKNNDIIFRNAMQYHMIVLSAIKISDQNYLYSNSNKIYHLTNSTIKPFDSGYISQINSVINIFKDSKQKIWINTKSNGTLLFDNSQLNTTPQQFFKNDFTTCVYEDVDHGYWITTTNTGIYYIPSLNFNYFNSSNGLSSNKIQEMSIVKNKLYCTLNDFRLNEIDLNTQKVTISKSNNYANSLLSFENNLMYNENGYSKILNVNTNKIMPIKVINATNFSNGKLTIKKAIDYNTDSLIGYNPTSILHKINKRTGIASEYFRIPSRIFSIYNANNTVYIGTKQGLYKIINNKLIFLGDSTPLLTNRVEAITSIKDTLFLATKGYGVFCYVKNKIIAQFNESNGLASNICKSIIKDKENSIWVGTNRGISRLKLDKAGNYICNTINLSNGLVSNEINEIVEYHNQLYFATNNGIGFFKINEAFEAHKSIPVYIEKCFINNQIVDYKKFKKLKYNENFIKIFYKGIFLKNEGDITYKYRLEGLDTNWIYTKNTFVQYTTLPPGDYKFIVYALNPNGLVGSLPETFIFTIQTPFWKTWWFITIIISGIIFISYLWYNQRIKIIKIKEKDKTNFNKQLAESELKALRAQMNPHFMFNAINSIQNFVLKNDSKSAQKYLTKFARLIRSVLENSKHEFVLLNKEIEALELYIELEVLRASFNFDYEIILEDSLNSDYFYIPPMIIQPYVENAILHGLNPLKDRRGKLIITFSQNNQTLNCIIDDNGIGREKALEFKRKKDLGRKSLGMEISKDRIELLNIQANLFTKINVIDKTENNISTGTTIEISIEIKNKKNDNSNYN